MYAWRAGSRGKCYLRENFSIPKGGFARIHQGEVKIYDHQNKHLRAVGVGKAPCN